MISLQIGDFTLHSGRKSSWKLDCDTLEDAEVDWLALKVIDMAWPFTGLRVVPSGDDSVVWRLSARIVSILHANRDMYPLPPDSTILLLDDVFTTGASLFLLKTEVRKEQKLLGIDSAVKAVVILARAPIPSWVEAIFRLEGP